MILIILPHIGKNGDKSLRAVEKKKDFVKYLVEKTCQRTLIGLNTP